MKWPHGDPDAVARSLLAEPAYRSSPLRAEPRETLAQMLWRAFVDHVLRPLLHPLERALGASHSASAAVAFGLSALALIGFGFVFFRLALGLAHHFDSKRDARSGASEARAQAHARTSQEWRALASAAAARGDFTRGVAALFSAALAALDERAVVAFDPARTPAEYRRLVGRSLARASGPFDELCAGFTRAIYAEAPAAPADFAAAERAYARFEPALAA